MDKTGVIISPFENPLALTATAIESDIGELKFEEVRYALSGVSPELYGSMRTYAFELEDSRYQYFNGRISTLRSVYNKGSKPASMSSASESSNSVFALHDSDLELATYVGGAGNWASFNQSDNYANYHYQYALAYAGADTVVIDNDTNRLSVGLLASGNWGSIGSGFGDIGVVGWNVSAYALWEPSEHIWVSAIFGGGINEYDTNRRFSDGSQDVSGSVDGATYGGSVGFGYEFALLNNASEDKLSIVPNLYVSVSQFSRDSFTESGGRNALNVDSLGKTNLSTSLGAQLLYGTMLGDLPFMTEVSLGWLHQYMDPSESFDASFANGSREYSLTVNTPGVGQDAVTYSVGIGLEVIDGGTVYLDYQGQMRTNGFVANGFNAGWRMQF